jgi:DNA primase
VVSVSALYLVAMHYGHVSGTIKEKEKICCPFHADDTPSMLLDYANDRYYCFGCGVTGNAIEYVHGMEKSNLTALTKYAKITKGKAEQRHSTYVHRTQSIDNLLVAKDFFTGLSCVNWYSVDRDNEQEQALQYLIARGVDIHKVAKHDIKVTYSVRYPIVIPLCDNGVFCGYVQRTFDKDSKRKYLYNKGFSRATSLIGQYGARDTAFVCEGIFDLIALSQAGYAACSVALMGCNPTREQISKLQQSGVTKVVSCLDADEAGERGAKELEKHFRVKRLVLPDGVNDVAELETAKLKKEINKLLNC